MTKRNLVAEVVTMSDIAKQYPSGKEPTGYAADGQASAPRVYAPGKEPTITAKGDDKAHGGVDLAK